MNLYCQNCKKAAAIVHVTEIHDGQKMELHFCEACAEAHGLPAKNPTVTMVQSLQDWMDKFGAVSKGKDRQCPQCGLSFNDFKVHGRFGCPNDYQVFKSRLLPLLERIHGTSAHGGSPTSVEISVETHKVRGAPESPEAAELKRLRLDLQRVVESEKYEEAAKIRDRILELERTLKRQEKPDA